MARADAEQGAMAAVLAGVDLSDRPDAGTVERRLRAALKAHGERQPPGLTGMSRLVAAGVAQRGTRTPRLLALGVRALARGVRPPDAEDRHALRSVHASSAALAGIAVLLTAGAVRATGWRRLPWAATALPVWLATARSFAVGTLVTTAVRVARSRST